MITVTRDKVEEIARDMEERRKQNPWDPQGDDLRIFTAIVAESAAKYVSLTLVVSGLTIMCMKGRPDEPKEMVKDPILTQLVAEIMYFGYRVGKAEAVHE